ncbi:hypothetical protein COCMIDRAFT_31458 [Bipolaris oryzae ATCC 44560]|uniref:Uncharacterized protein n=1 Tax=Bipolaris oryzae ATCC 44560 TaxID=930090 RepID=W7A5C1_COCMI|nr:uncharacterized protein COCMIDRAFT_31458 [Bipolaris oryzae ATCC 44560]EUC51321.1 hypothetical protein COCMIDRAFT_31458 [Bipolaris oryzae ATCC 44560]
MCVRTSVCAWSFMGHGGCFRHRHDDACAQHPRYGTTLRHGVAELTAPRGAHTRHHSGPANLSECTGFSSSPFSSSSKPAPPVQPIPSSASKQSLLKERDIRYESFTLRDNR